jgi:hypothetical protein
MEKQHEQGENVCYVLFGYGQNARHGSDVFCHPFPSQSSLRKPSVSHDVRVERKCHQISPVEQARYWKRSMHWHSLFIKWSIWKVFVEIHEASEEVLCISVGKGPFSRS